jgi:drug/metabolite transporter (DMT)-like permease
MKLSKGFYLTFTAAIIWTISIIITRIILKNGENTYNVLFWTTILATPYWFFVLRKKGKELITISKKSYLILLGIGLISTIGVNIVELFALKYSPAVNYSFLIRSTLLFTIFFAYFFLGEALTVKKIIISILILTGIYLLTTKGHFISLSLGDTFTLIEAMLISFGNTILGKMATNKMSTGLCTSASFLIGVLPIITIALLSHSISVPKFPLLILSLVVLGILSMTVRFQAYKHATATYVTMIYSFTPVFVLLAGISFLKETLSPIQLFGGILILLGCVFAEKLKM